MKRSSTLRYIGPRCHNFAARFAVLSSIFFHRNSFAWTLLSAVKWSWGVKCQTCTSFSRREPIPSLYVYFYKQGCFYYRLKSLSPLQEQIFIVYIYFLQREKCKEFIVNLRQDYSDLYIIYTLQFTVLTLYFKYKSVWRRTYFAT